MCGNVARQQSWTGTSSGFLLTCPQIAEPFKLNQCSPSSLQRWQCEWNPVWEELRNGNDGDLWVFLKEWHHGTISIQISKDIHLHSTPLWDQRYPYHQVQLQKSKVLGVGQVRWMFSFFQVRVFQLASMGHSFYHTLEKDASTGSSSHLKTMDQFRLTDACCYLVKYTSKLNANIAYPEVHCIKYAKVIILKTGCQETKGKPGCPSSIGTRSPEQRRGNYPFFSSNSITLLWLWLK